LIEALLLAGSACAVLALHTRWVFTHFSSDGYLLDSGWLAYLFGNADPLLRNPSSINALSFYAHHLSPHIFLFGAPLVLLFGASGITVFAYHQGLFFSLFFVATCLVAAAAPVGDPTRAILLASSVLIGALSNAVLQAAAYPHYEMAVLTGTALALAAWLRGYWRLFAACMIWLPLVREDGGFFAAFVCVMGITLEGWTARPLPPRVRTLATVAALEVIVAVCAFVVKATVFPGFDAFSGNFSGAAWNHVTLPFLADRLRSLAGNPTIVPVVAGTVFLATRDLRYAAGLILLSPLYGLHILSVRPEHGNFTLYYALPWLLPPLTWLAVFTARRRAARTGVAEALVIGLASLALTAPLHAALGLRGQFWYVAEWSVTRPVVNLASMTEFVRWTLDYYGEKPEPAPAAGSQPCASVGIAALTPNSFTPEQVVNGRSDVARCRPLLLLRADLDYPVVSTHAERLGFALTGSRHNAELWLRSTR
jgi:hypothetical protein